jgi:hypothetical protein
MPVVEKPSHEDMILYEIMRHPVLMGEFFYNVDLEPEDEPFELTGYQKEFICDFGSFVSLCCGRSVGKTISLGVIICWLLINQVFKGDYIVYVVPNKVHLDPVFNHLSRLFRVNSLLKQFIDPKKGINSSTHTIKLLNFTTLDCRIAGTTGTGTNVVGMHSPFEILDESGFFPWGTWIELQPTLNQWQKGFRLIVSGVPIGLRENNVCYYADEIDDKFSIHRVTAHQNPRYTPEKEKENLEQYGGEDSEDYIHHVLGRHGSPTFAVFDRNLMLIKQYPVYKVKVDGTVVTDVSEIYNKLSVLPKIESKIDYTLVGIDLGYTEPTAIHILYSKEAQLFYHARIQLTKVAYPLQKKLIDFLDDKFGRFDIIGIDSGGPGKPFVQDLLEADDFIHKDYKKRMFPIEFASQIVLGLDADGNEIKTKLKPFAVSLAQEYSNSHKIIYSSTDMEFVSELERTTYTKTPSGEVVYRTLTLRGGEKGEDHHTSALLCASVAHYLVKDASQNRHKSKRLYTPTWFADRMLL